MIYIYTHAYNARKTLPRAIESILSQTKGDFIWYLCDNASTDDTREIILSYAEKDKRIIPELRNINHLHPDYKGPLLFWLPTLTKLCENGYPEDFFCTLDADDEYKPDFFEKMLRFINENALEVAACGSDFIDAKTNRITGQRTLRQNLILDSNEKFSAHFPEYHQFMRPVWGKLYRFSLIKQCGYENYINNFQFPYGVDTLFCMRAFSCAKRAGILAETLHKYAVSLSSTSYNFDNKRIIADQILDDETRGFLLGKTGRITPENNDFLEIVYFNATVDTLSVLLRSKIPTAEKISYLKDLTLNEKSRALYLSRSIYNYGLDKKMRTPIIQYLLSLKECRKPDYAESACEIIMAMYDDLRQIISRDGLHYIIMKMPEVVEYLLHKDYQRILERLHTWYKRHDADVPSLTEFEISIYRASGKSDEEVFMLFTSIRKNRQQSFKELDIDTQICRIMGRYPLLENISCDLAFTFSQAIRWVMKKDYKQALGAFVSEQQVEINYNDAEAYILFGQNLSAAAEDVDVYIYFKKLWISYLLDYSREEEARRELNEFTQILPDDEDFVELRKRLE